MKAITQTMEEIFQYKGGKLFRDGKEAGHIDQKGYRIVKFKQKAYKAHRVVWFLHHGKWPDGEIDHINRIRHDNRIENLRVVTRSEQMRNKGNVGVTRARNKWKARLGQKHLGHFDSYTEAMKARKAAESRYWS